MSTTSKVDALQARIKSAVGKAAAEYGARNASKDDSGKVVRPKPPRRWFESQVSALVRLEHVIEAFVDDVSQ